MDFHLEGSTKYIDVTDLVGDLYVTHYLYASAEILIRLESPTGAVLYQNAGYTTDDYTAPDMTTIAPSNYIVSGIAVPAVGNLIAEGEYTLRYKLSFDGSGTTDLAFSKSYMFKVSKPSVAIKHEASCISSQLTFTDITTTYAITDYYGNSKSPTAVSRSWLVIYPNSVLPNVTETLNEFTIGFGTAYNSGQEIYRGSYQASLESTAYYPMEMFSLAAPALNWITVYLTSTNQVIFDISCPDCSCNYYTCLTALENSREEYRVSGNQSQVDIYEKRIARLSWYWNLYNLAIRCGKDATIWCERIRNIALATTECCDDMPTTPTKITAWVAGIGGGSGGSGTTWHFRECSDGLPAGVVGDAVFFTGAAVFPYSPYDVYTFGVGGWIYQGNLRGAAGSTSTYLPVLHYDATTTNSNVSAARHTLKTYNIVANELESNGDFIVAESIVYVNAGIETELFVSYGGTDVLTYYVFPMINTTLKIFVEIARSGANAQVIIPRVTINGVPDETITMALVPETKDNSLAQVLNFDVDKVLAGLVADVRMLNFKVLKYKI